MNKIKNKRNYWLDCFGNLTTSGYGAGVTDKILLCPFSQKHCGEHCPFFEIVEKDIAYARLNCKKFEIVLDNTIEK